MTSFSEILNEARDIVAKAYPGARLYEADGTSSLGEVDEENDLDTWRFVFLGPVRWDQAKIVVLDYREGHFETPALEREPFSEDSLKFSLEEAIARKKKAGNDEPFHRVNLRWHFSPGDDEPFYVFGSSSSPFVFVGVKSGAVTMMSAKPLSSPT